MNTNDLTGKKLLILCGIPPHNLLVETANKMGIYTIVTDYWAPERSPGKLLADEYWMLDIMDVDAIVEKCRMEHVDAVINACVDPAQHPYQQICERLGLPCFGTKEQFHIMTDKRAFKALCRKCGMDVVPDYSIEDCKDGTAAFPVIVKPVDSRSGHGQVVCSCAEEIDAAIKIAVGESCKGEYLIEPYIPHTMDMILIFMVCGGEAHIVRAADRHCGMVQDGLNRAAVALISPSVYSDTLVKNAEEACRNFIKKLGIKNGPVFLQGFPSGDRILWFDPALRIGGSNYYHSYFEATKVNLMSVLIRCALGENVEKFGNMMEGGWHLNGKRDLQIACNLRSGTVKEIRGKESLETNPTVNAIWQRVFVGDQIEETGDGRQNACTVGVLVEDTKTQMHSAFDLVHNTLFYMDERGDMKIPFTQAGEICELYEEKG